MVAATVDIIRRLDSTYLPIQGPPGTGKTYDSSEAILALLRDGKRVAVTSNSHKAISNLMAEVAVRAREQEFALQAIQKFSNGEPPPDLAIEVTRSNYDARLSTYSLVAGTAWLFARPEHDQQFDYLFVDEAGQIALANIVAAGAAARNIVLVGDPMQLAQPIQGTHPGQSGASGLGYLLDGFATVPPERGIFLPVSRRLHPLICSYVSDVVYDGGLKSDSAPPARLCFSSTTTRRPPDCASSPYSTLTTASRAWRRLKSSAMPTVASSVKVPRSDGKERQIGKTDILIVTPYNAQVNLLKRLLPSNARVGTVQSHTDADTAERRVTVGD